MVDLSKFRFRIGDRVETERGIYTIKAYYFSNECNDFSAAYGYTVDKPNHSGSDYSYNEYGEHVQFPPNSVMYILEDRVLRLIESCKKHTIEVSLDDAVRWYASDNKELRELALRAFKESDLIQDYEYIIDYMERNNETTCTCRTIPKRKEERIRALIKLEVLASYLNEGWEKPENHRGYVLYYSGDICNGFDSSCVRTEEYFNNVFGIVFFKTKELALKAKDLMGDDLKYLFI